MKSLLFAFLAACVACSHASQRAPTNTMVLSTTPKEVYGAHGAPVKLRLGNGGAGPTGVLRALAEDFLAMKQADYAIAWYQNISRFTLEALKNGTIDIAMTYEREQEEPYVKAGWATEGTLVFNDHFVVVGPKQNPAGIAADEPVEGAFAKIAALGAKGTARVFLSRDDASATNIKEKAIWAQVGTMPWSHASPAWYYRYTVFPRDALVAADNDGLYTIIDEGTWLSTRPQLKNSVVYVRGGELLRNPCVALLSGSPSPLAREFRAYMVSPRGQAVIANYGRAANNGDAFFTPAAQPDFAPSKS